MAGILCRVILAASLFGSLWSAGYAATETGKAVAVVQSASATGDDGERTLEAGMAVFLGERIKTGRTGQVQLIFTDDTKLVIGPNSSLVIEAYLLRSKSIVSKFAVKALGGSFRFITGKSPKQAYSITTPTGAIGVRGTIFDLAVLRRFDIVLSLVGVPEVCSNGVCLLAPKSCSLARSPRNGKPSLVNSLDQRNRLIRLFLPYIVSQAALGPGFQAPVESCGIITKSEIEQDPSQEASTEGSVPSATAGAGLAGAGLVGAGLIGVLGASTSFGTGDVAVTK
jgi:hypothetical protein